MFSSKVCRISMSLSPRIISRKYCSTGSANETAESKDSSPQKPGGFHQAFLKYTQMEKSDTIKDDVPFATLMRHSKFVDLGNPAGKVVTGTIFHIVNDDLYIDFGGKFHCVCPRPPKNGDSYVRGAVVKLKLKELELSTRFLGSDKDLSLHEADADLIGIVSSPKK